LICMGRGERDEAEVGPSAGYISLGPGRK
jgi:hypothetical protein